MSHRFDSDVDSVSRPKTLLGRRSSDPVAAKKISQLNSSLLDDSMDDLRQTRSTPVISHKRDWLDEKGAFAEFGLGFARTYSKKFTFDREETVKKEGEGLAVNDVAKTFWAFFLGCGMLSLPHALATSGLLGIAVLFFVQMLNMFTSALMSRVLNDLTPVADAKGIPLLQRDWIFLASEIWGPTGKFLMRVFLGIELFGYVVANPLIASVYLKEMLYNIYPLSATACAVIATVVGLLFCMVPVKAFVHVNMAATVLSFTACLSILGTGLLLPEWPDLQQQPILDPPGLMNSIGIMLFSGAYHSLYPTLYQGMQEPEQYEKANTKSYAGFLLFLLLVIVPTYVMFGTSVKQTFVTNIGNGLDVQPLGGFSGWPVLRSLSAAGVMARCLCAVPFVTKPLAVLMVGMCSTPGQKSGPMGLSEELAINLGQALALIVALLFSIKFADDMALVLDVIGGVLCANISLVVPALAYWWVFHKDIGVMTKAALFASVLFGAAMMCDTVINQFV